jgi:hypothetical protein
VETKRFASFVSSFALIAVLASAPLRVRGQQGPAPAPKPAPANPPVNATLQNIANQGIPITVTGMPGVNDVSSTISVEAVLLPYRVAKRTFGKEVANKYAVISLTVSNRDPKQGMILHSVFLDYSRWLFSGIFAGMSASAKPHTELWQQQTQPSQVASAEVRTVRTDFQDAQLWSARNMVIHIATGVGATAASLAFASGSSLFAPSVAAFTGNVVPAIGLVWPDNSQAQLNLLNDIGFRTNRVIPAKSSDVVIAFFPIERFLTPTLQAIYKDAPAAFFNPSEIIFDKPGRSGVGKFMREIESIGVIQPAPCHSASGQSQGTASVQCALVNSVIHYEKAYEQVKLKAGSGPVANPCALPPVAPLTEDDCTNVDLLNRISLNNIRVVVGGIMTVDVSSVPATISSVRIANETQPGAWKSGQKISGTLIGSFLSGGTISINGTGPDQKPLAAAALGAVQPDQTTASDISLPFSLTLGADVPQGTKLAFTVTKTAQDKSVTTSSPFIYNVSSDPVITLDPSSKWEKQQTFKGTLTGIGLSGVSIVSVSGKDPSGKILPAGNFPSHSVAPAAAPDTDTKLGFTVTIGDTAVPAGSTLVFTLSTQRADGSPVTISCTVPSS